METKSPKMQKCLDQISQAAKTDWSIVLQGETGSGKNIMAQYIHDMSNRHDKPFVELDIGTIPESTIDSELFGHVKGAFTGAENRKIGFFEAANLGTIFIDELENITPAIQIKLLRVIADKTIYPMGSTSSIDVDVRIIIATNQNLKDLKNQGKLREDLYYRLDVIVIDIPPLRDRLEDLPHLANKFLNGACRELKRDIKSIPENVMDYLSGYGYPGNIRELKNIILRAALFSGYNSEISIENIGNLVDTEPIINEEYEFNPPVMTLKDADGIYRRQIEVPIIKKVLKICKNNKTTATKILDINYKTLLKKITDYKLMPEYIIILLLALTFMTDINDNFRQTRGNCRAKTRTSQRAKTKKGSEK